METNNHGLTSQSLDSQYFPDEVVEEILSRLPVRSLIRFKSVCKSWCNLISTKDFTFLHFNNYKPPPSHLLLSGIDVFSFVTVSSNEAAEEALPIVSSSIVNYPPCPFNKYLVNYPACPFNKLSYLRVSGPCNGIFCLYGWHLDNDLVLWNPAIQDFKIIPQSNLSRLGPIGIFSVGFCFDPETNDYKILQIVIDNKGYQHQLYSLRTNSWRKLEFTQTLNTSFHINYFSDQFTANRKIGWIALDSQLPMKSRKCQIYLFDASSETFDVIPVSCHIAKKGDKPYVFLFKESIAVVISRKIRKSRGYFEIWVWNDFGCTHSRSWSKLCTIEHVGGLDQPLGFWENSYLIFQHSLTRNLMLYDLFNRYVVDLGVGDVPKKSIRSALVYKESLISISNERC